MSDDDEEPSWLAWMRLAEKLGVTESYEDLQGIRQEVAVATRLQMLNALGFTDRLDLDFAERWPQPRLEVPAGVRCFVPASLSEKKAWGISAQVYELVSSRNWGIGDIEDVKNSVPYCC